MTSYLFPLQFAIISGVLFELAAIPITKLQKDFRNKLFKQLKQCKLLTIFRLILNKHFWSSFITFILAAFAFYFMLINSFSDTGVLYIMQFIYFLLALLITFKFVDPRVRQILRENASHGSHCISKMPELIFNPDPDSHLIPGVSTKKNDTISSEFKEEKSAMADLNPSELKTTEIKAIETSFQEIYNLLNLNLIEPLRKNDSRFAIPGPPYPAAYLWDSAFISNIWRLWDANIAREIMMPFLIHQKEDGLCPQTVNLGVFPNYKITNPPLIAWALLEACGMDEDYSVFSKKIDGFTVYERLKKYNKFLYEKRMKNGLFVWKHSYESGIDNSPRFTDASEKKKIDIENVWAVDFNTWMVLQNDSLAKIAARLGFLEDERFFNSKKAELIEKINKHLWDEETGLYYDFNFKKKQFIKIATIFSLFPLFVGVPFSNTNRLESLLSKLHDPVKFNTLIPFPTVALDEDTFMKDCWRGPVWLNTSYIIIKSLENENILKFLASSSSDRYKGNDNGLVHDFAYKIALGVAMTMRNVGSIYEFYDPENYHLDELTRKKGNLFKQITLGGKPVKKFVGWSGLSNTLLIENVIGYRRNYGQTQIEPHLPKDWRGYSLVLTIPQFDEILYLDYKSDDEIFAKIIKKNFNRAFDEERKRNGSGADSEEILMKGKNHATLRRFSDY